MVNWTEAQQQAIEARNCNLLVAAAAGSGKTAVLVERIIQMIVKDKIDIDRLLIVTFTNAAAGEMRERISAAIMAELEKNNANELHLKRQLNLLNHASISTIHAFCTEIIRRYFHIINIDPKFRIGDSTETELIKLEALEELFEAEYEKNSSYFLGLVEMFSSSKSDEGLQELVINLYEFIQSQPYPGQWLHERIKDFNMNMDEIIICPWVQTIRQQFIIQLHAARDIFNQALDLINQPGGPVDYTEALTGDISITDELIAALNTSIFSFYNKLPEIQHPRLKRAAKDADQAIIDQVKGLRDEGKSIITEMKKQGFKGNPEEYVKDLNELYPYMTYLYEITETFQHIYSEKKHDKGIVDFNDLEHYALEILADEKVAGEYRDQFEYIFIDEYQDSNLVQETILNFIKRDNNFFMVGDVKQSIYRFRLADPSLFITKYKQFMDQEGALNRRIDLNQNFRSQVPIINAVNYIFRHIMSEAFGEINYDNNAFLYPGLKGEASEEGVVELCLVEKEIDEPEMQEDIEELGNIEVEARIVAARIKALLGKQVFDAKLQCYRNLDYRDIVVLLRTTRNRAGVFLDSFTSEGIPAYADTNTGYFEAVEIKIFLNLLRIIDNKRQDIPLLSVMRSTIADFTIDELVEIRLASRKATYYAAIEEYRENNTSPLQQKLDDFMQKLNKWKEESIFIPLDEFIWKLLLDTGYYHYTGAMPGGRQRQANLRVLINRARQFQQTAMKGIFNFLKFIDKLNSSSGDMGEARILGENDNVVRIMSIHKSKGLEFPVVIVAGLGKQFNLSDTTGKVLFHRELGIGPRYVNVELRGYYDTLARIAMKEKIKIENLSEEMRILYVACTRPKNKLILVGSIKKITDAARNWSRPVSPYSLSRAKNLLDWIGPLIMRHPDGTKLREATGIPWDSEKLQIDDARFEVTILDRYKASIEKVESQEKQNQLKDVLINFPFAEYCSKDSSEHRVISDRLNWQYPFREAEKIPSKLSVTSILGRGQMDIENLGINIPLLLKRPIFMEGTRALTGADKGTIIHFVMQHLDFSRVENTSQIAEQVKEMVAKELLVPEWADAIEYEKILKFFTSEIGQRVLAADKVYREVPFNQVRIAGDILDSLENSTEKLLIQGVIDLFFIEKDELVLLDYKTDFIMPSNREQVINKYIPQLTLYKNALEQIQQKRVKESY
ncbi:MAG: helicase-exonuclease AddAB subunit AddA, partial [Syntrophomonadaceae bacterium]|nr:helicase-exonuclease AddAB subunit AddA [Syntrophomonadaceae bacterium]